MNLINDLQYIALATATDLDDKTIQNFDCGNADMTEYLHSFAKTDAATGNGVTYVLVNKSRSRIYAYATLRAFGLYSYADADDYHTTPTYSNGTVLVSIPAAEIKMFAVCKQLKHVVAYDTDTSSPKHYSTLFFLMLLENLYYMAMDTIGFRIIFLRANDEGEHLYRNNGFVECDQFLESYDSKADGCIPLMLNFQDLENVIFTN